MNSRKGLIRFVIAAVLVILSLVSYYSNSSVNEVTGEKQHISISPEQEIQLGLDGRDYMIQQSGGLLNDDQSQNYIKSLGHKIVNNSEASKTPYKYDFHILADPNTVNAFALPGGQIFITVGLLKRLDSEGQVAGVLGHEIGHVVARHSAEQMAKQNLTQGLVGAAAVAGGDYTSAQYAQMIGNMVNLKYGRGDELEADELGVRFMSQAGYNPESLIDVMKVLEQASGGSSQPEFTSTHPSPQNRIEKIKAAIEKYRNN